METFRCPTCLSVLADPDAARCPTCNKKLRRRRGRKPVVLGDRTKFGSYAPLHIDVVLAERVEREQKAAERAKAEPEPAVTARVDSAAGSTLTTSPPPPVAAAPVEAPVVETPPVIETPPVAETPPAAAAPPVAPAGGHTSIFEPSQLDPEMRAMLDGLYRKARAEIEEERQDR